MAGMTVSAEWVTAVFILGAGISVLYRLLSRRTGPKEVNVEKRDPDHHDLFEGGMLLRMKREMIFGIQMRIKQCCYRVRKIR